MCFLPELDLGPLSADSSSGVAIRGPSMLASFGGAALSIMVTEVAQCRSSFGAVGRDRDGSVTVASAALDSFPVDGC